MRWMSVLLIVMFSSTNAYAAAPLPAEVQASVNDLLHDCKDKTAFTKGFLTRRDINGDGVEDYILDLGHFVCGENSILYCGSAGCTTTVFASLPGGKYAKVLDENVRGLEFKKLGGRPAMILGLHGSACGKAGAEPCGATLYWNGSAFTPAH